MERNISGMDIGQSDDGECMNPMSKDAGKRLETSEKREFHLKGPEVTFESPTPEKLETERKGIGLSSLSRNLLKEDFEHMSTTESSTTGNDLLDKSIENDIPEKYQTLLHLFTRMDTSLRLLCLRHRKPTFTNIRTQVEVLTKRQFSYSQLAQMKFLFPDAIHIKRILSHDQKSLCMYPDLEITLLLDYAAPTSAEQSLSVALCQAFRARLLNFLKTNPKDTEIPKATLPDPFNISSSESLVEKDAVNSVIKEPALCEVEELGHVAEIPESLLPDSIQKQLLTGNKSLENQELTTSDVELSSASHFSSSFQKFFSQKMYEDIEKTPLLADPAVLNLLSEDEKNTTNHRKIDKSDNDEDLHVDVTTVSQNMDHDIKKTPAKESTESMVMGVTPAMETPKRPALSPNDKPECDVDSFDDPKWVTSARKSLKWSPLKVDKQLSKNGAAIQDASSQVLAEENRTMPLIGISGSPADHGATSECIGKNSSLAVTFDVLWSISQSKSGSMVTKQQLVHKIITGNWEIEETSEVDKHLEILERAVHDWIAKIVTPDDEIFYRFQRAADKNLLWSRVADATKESARLLTL